MVANATSFARSGLADFIVQRITAVIIGIYVVAVLVFFLGNPNLDHAELTAWFGSFPMQAFTTAAVLSTAAHAWIGLWTVGTDYLLPAHIGKQATAIRFVYQLGCVTILFVYVLWAMNLVWSL
jgi:succinate dehydrogenase / fumarate reductase, membrane anchor subunit